MVRVAGLERQAASGLDVRSPDGRSPHAALDEIAGRVREQVSRQSALWERDLVPALGEAGIRIGRVEQGTRAELRALAVHYEREIYPVLTPLAIGPGQPFPYISGLSLSLGVFVRDPASGEERLARVKVPEGMPRFVTIGRDRLTFPLEEVIAHFLTRLFPGMEVVESAPFRVTRDADFEVSDDADDLLQAVQVELRRRRFGDVVRLEVAHDMSPRMQRRLVDSLDVTDRQVFRIHSMLDLADVSQVADLDRPDLKYEPWVGMVPPRFATGDRKAMFAADRCRRHPDPPAVRLVRRHRRGVHQRRRPRSRLGGAEDDRVPHQRALAADPGPDPGRRGGQAERVRGRAQGPLRREPQHPLVEGPGRGGHPRRLRLPQPQGARQDDADRPPRGPRAAPVRPHRHRQLSRPHGPPVRGLRPVHRRQRHHRRRRRPLQPADRVRPAADVPQAPGRALHAAAQAARAHPGGGRRRAGRASTPGSGSRSTTSPTSRSSTACTRLRGRARRSTSSRAACARCAPASRA